MRLPFVSRAAFDLSQHNAQMLHQIVKEHADERYDRLLTMYHELALRVTEPRKQTLDAIPAAGHTVEPPPAAPLPPIDATIELWLDAKFVRGTPIWRQQYREAMKLKAEGLEAERIIDTLGKGQAVEF